jgi:glycosyltransferase involved in cell wall biosynthesis
METTSGGGINKTIREIGANLVRKGHEVTVLQTNPLNLPNEETCSGFKIIRVKSRLGEFIHNLSLEIYLFLKESFTRLNPDVVHVHGYGTLLTPELLFFLRSKKCAVVFSPHYGPESHDTYSGKYLWNIYNKLIGKHLFDVADKIVCASRFESENIQCAFGVANDKIEIIPHGIDRVETSRADKRNDECISLVYYGWLIEIKGVQYILKALRELEKTLHKRAQLSIIGQGRYKSTLFQLAKELGVESLISWYPFLFGEELCKKISEADVSLLISRSENYGIQVAEVLAMGIPCIVAKNTALVEFLDEPGCFGVDYPPNTTALAELIINIKDRNPKVGPLSDRIRTWDKVVDDYERVYASLLSERVHRNAAVGYK